MKFWLGFTIGAALGAYIVSNMTLDQRQNTSQAFERTAAKMRCSPVGSAVASGAGNIKHAASDRVSATVDSGADSVAGFVEPDGSTVTGSSI